MTLLELAHIINPKDPLLELAQQNPEQFYISSSEFDEAVCAHHKCPAFRELVITNNKAMVRIRKGASWVDREIDVTPIHTKEELISLIRVVCKVAV